MITALDSRLGRVIRHLPGWTSPLFPITTLLVQERLCPTHVHVRITPIRCLGAVWRWLNQPVYW